VKRSAGPAFDFAAFAHRFARCASDLRQLIAGQVQNDFVVENEAKLGVMTICLFHDDPQCAPESPDGGRDALSSASSILVFDCLFVLVVFSAVPGRATALAAKAVRIARPADGLLQTLVGQVHDDFTVKLEHSRLTLDFLHGDSPR
jgi:hypothetical protein